MTVQELYASIGSYEDVKARLMSDSIIARIVVKFPNDLSFEQLIQAWEQGDHAEVFRAAHTMKGVCANLGLSQLFATLSEIVEAYRPGQEGEQSAVDMADQVEILKLQYDQAVKEIQKFASEQ